MRKKIYKGHTFTLYKYIFGLYGQFDQVFFKSIAHNGF